MVVSQATAARYKQHGFTLLEVVVTLAIMVTVMVAVTTLLRNTFEVKDSLSQKNKVSQRLNRAVSKISEDMAHAFLLHPRWQQERTGGIDRTRFIIKKAASSDRLAFTYMGHTALKANSAESELSYVVYELRESQDVPGRRDLYRGELPRIPSKDFRFREDPPMRLFVRGIHTLTALPWNGEDWSRHGWDSTRGDTDKNIPHMVLLQVAGWEEEPSPDAPSSAEGEELLVHYNTVVYLPYALDYKEPKMRNSSFRWKL